MKGLVSSLLLAALIAAFALLTTHTPNRPSPDEPERLSRASVKAALGTREDPNARLRYEFERLKDPRTGLIPPDIHIKERKFAETLPKKGAVSKSASSSWNRRGPVNIGGRTRALAIDVTDDDRIVAGGVSGGVWISPDAGATWSKATAPLALHNVTAIVQDTRSGQTGTWYATSGELAGNSASGDGAMFVGDGIFKSTDGGLSWTQILVSGTPQDFDSAIEIGNALAIDASNTIGDEVYFAAYGVIYRSMDGGSNWSAVQYDEVSGQANTPWTDVAVTSSGIVYTAFESDGGPDGVFRSTTGAQGSFSDLNAPFASGFQRIKLAISPANEDQVWALVYSPGAPLPDHELWKYDDNGGVWTDYTNYLPTRGGETGNFTTQGGYDQIIAAHPTNTDIVFVGGTNLFRIDVSVAPGDGTGNTWIGGYTHADVNSFAMYAGPNGTRQHPDQHAIAFPYLSGGADPDVMLVGSDGGIHRTDNSVVSGDGQVSWTSLNSGYFTTQFYTVCQNSSVADPFLGGGMQDNGTWGTTTTSSSVAWSEELSGDGSYCQVADRSGASTNRYRYVSAQLGFLVRNLVTATGSLIGQAVIDPNGGTGYRFIAPFVLDPADEQILFLLESNTVWRTSNAETASPSSGWTDLAPTGISGAETTALAVSEAPTAHTLFLGTSGCRLYKISNAHTASPGTAAIDVTPGDLAALTDCTISDIAVDPTNHDHILVGVSNYLTKSVFHSLDGGGSWSDVEGNLAGDSGPSVRSVAIMPGTDDPYYVGTSTGLYSATSMAGSSTVWTQEGTTGDAMGNVVVDMVRGRESDGLVIVATHGGGVYSSIVTLAVELSTFTAVGNGDAFDLQWTTSSETDNVGFDIEYRRVADEHFTRHGFLPGSGTSNEARTYRYRLTDMIPARYEFRLKQLDVDGTHAYSDIVEAEVELSAAMETSAAFPNPTAETASIEVVVREAQHVTMDVFDVAGRKIRALYDGELPAGTPTRVEIQTHGMSNGVYFVRVRANSSTQTRRLVVAR